jgi:putative N-acetylmannosamine-6-phosphate epimerase
MAKLSITAAPLFKAKVKIPVAGAAAVEVDFTFKHRTKKDLDLFLKALTDKKEEDIILEMVTTWELDEPLNAENVAVFLENYMSAGAAILESYVSELYKAREKN